MRILPYSSCKAVPTSELMMYECSDRLLVPRSMESYTPLTILMIENFLKETVVGCVYQVHEIEAEVIYAPSWMFYQLSICYDVRVSIIPPVRCTHLRLQPHRPDRFTTPDAVSLLNKALLNYKSVTQHTRILIQMNPPEHVTVELTHPERYKTCFLHESEDIQVTILMPVMPPYPMH